MTQISEERLDEIREEAARRPRREYGQTKVDELLAEIDRLRLREKALERVRQAVQDFGESWRACGDPTAATGRCGECAGCYLDAVYTAARLSPSPSSPEESK